MIGGNQCGQILKVIGNKFSDKSIRKLCDFLSYFEIHQFRVKTAMPTFWATFGIILAYFILTSGHADWRPN